MGEKQSALVLVSRLLTWTVHINSLKQIKPSNYCVMIKTTLNNNFKNCLSKYITWYIPSMSTSRGNIMARASWTWASYKMCTSLPTREYACFASIAHLNILHWRKLNFFIAKISKKRCGLLGLCTNYVTPTGRGGVTSSIIIAFFHLHTRG